MSILNFLKNRNKEKAGKERFILCIDGGGIRGIIPAIILERIEKVLRETGKNGSLPSYFDMVAGTSTGGLIAACLTCTSSVERKQTSDGTQICLEKMTEMYRNMGKAIFPSTKLGIVNATMQVLSDKYPSAGLEKILAGLYANTLLCDAQVPTMIMAYDVSEGKPAVLGSYDNDEITVAQACRATSAAPTYFAPLEYNGHLLVDGGVIANNPSLYAYYEAKKLYPDCSKFHILSLGTAGEVHRAKLASGGIINWIEHLSPMFTTAQKQTVQYVMDSNDEIDYLRIDAEMSEFVKMDSTDASTISKLEVFANNLADQNEKRIREFLDKIR